MIGVLSSEPKTPPLVIVKDPPLDLLERQRPVLGALREIRDRRFDLQNDILPASRRTGTTSPVLAPTAMPMS